MLALFIVYACFRCSKTEGCFLPQRCVPEHFSSIKSPSWHVRGRTLRAQKITCLRIRLVTACKSNLRSIALSNNAPLMSLRPWLHQHLSLRTFVKPRSFSSSPAVIPSSAFWSMLNFSVRSDAPSLTGPARLAAVVTQRVSNWQDLRSCPQWSNNDAPSAVTSWAVTHLLPRWDRKFTTQLLLMLCSITSQEQNSDYSSSNPLITPSLWRVLLPR